MTKFIAISIFTFNFFFLSKTFATGAEILQMPQERFDNLLENAANSPNPVESKRFLTSLKSLSGIRNPEGIRPLSTMTIEKTQDFMDTINEKQVDLASKLELLRDMEHENRYYSKYIPLAALLIVLSTSTYYSWYEKKPAKNAKLLCKLKSKKDEAWYTLEDTDIFHEDQSVSLYTFSRKAQIDLGNIDFVLKRLCSELESKIFSSMSEDQSDEILHKSNAQDYELGITVPDNTLQDIGEEVIAPNGQVLSYKIDQSFAFNLR